MFRKSFSRNQHDSSVTPAGNERANARHAIHNDVAKRCNLIMAYLVKYHAYFTGNVTQSEIVNYMQGVDESYSETDVVYALEKMHKEGFLDRCLHPDYTSDSLVKLVWYKPHWNPTEVKITFK